MHGTGNLSKSMKFRQTLPLYLMMGRIDDADEVYLNGKEIGKSGKFPPDYVTAYDRTRKYIIPAGYLKEDGENVIAVKVYDSYLEGGIVDGPTGIYIDEDNDFLESEFKRQMEISNR